MKKVRQLLMAAGVTVLLAGCGSAQNSDTAAAPAEEEAPAQETETEATEPEEVSAEPEAEEQEADAEEEPEAEKESDVEDIPEDEKNPMALWEYEGYVDECREYLWRDEFVNWDIDGDGTTDRLYRTCDPDAQTAVYTIEFGDGRKQELPEGWDTGFPHIQAGDTDGDGEKELLFTLTYNTSTDPWAYGDMWLLDYTDAASGYQEVELPLERGENGARLLTIEFGKPDGGNVPIRVAQNGFTADIDFGEGFVENWMGVAAFTEDRMVYSAEIRDDGKIFCSIEIYNKSQKCLYFELEYKNGTYEIANMTY